MNLITNSFHAVEGTNGEIVVELKEAELGEADKTGHSLKPGQYAMLTIADNGHGIQPEIMDKIFNPYFTTKEKGKGTGLGLATVYGIVKEHHGEIKVSSLPGKGARFSIYFPLIRQKGIGHPSQPYGRMMGGSEKILLVDDETPIVKLQRQMLERLGYEVTSRTSSSDALEAFKASPQSFDAVISDMNMPNLSGDQLAEKIRSIRPDIPIILCTGFSEKINKERAMEIGINGFLMKPVVKSEMARTLRKVLYKGKKTSPKNLPTDTKQVEYGILFTNFFPANDPLKLTTIQNSSIACCFFMLH